jgi:DNA mismatch repair ATPase MutS
MQKSKLCTIVMVAAFGLLPFFISAQVGYLPPYFKDSNRLEKLSTAFPVVEKMVQKKAIGAIATHDLEVCNITSSYPKNLSNNCFEVEIIDDELVFDYSLREGICKNKSASFLMNKMGII